MRFRIRLKDERDRVQQLATEQARETVFLESELGKKKKRKQEIKIRH